MKRLKKLVAVIGAVTMLATGFTLATLAQTADAASPVSLQTSEGKEEAITTLATTGLPWYFSYAFDWGLYGATKFYYDSKKGRLKIYMNSRTPYLDYGVLGYSGYFKVTLMRDPTFGGDYAVSHASYPRNDDKTVVYTYQYGGSRLPSGNYWLKFENPKLSNNDPPPYITGKGTASYTSY